MRKTLSAVSLLLNRYTFFFLFMLGFTHVLSLRGGLAPLWYSLRLEAPILLYCYFLCNSLLKKSPWQPWLAALPIVLAYTIADIYHMIYGRMVHVIEITEIPEMFDVLPGHYIALIAIVGLVSVVTLATAIDWRNWRHSLMISTPALILILSIELIPEHFLLTFQAIASPVVDWSESESVVNNGRITMVAYYEALRKNSIAKTLSFRHKQKFIDEMNSLSRQIQISSRNRNVHLVVLESFLDPTLFAGLKFSQSPTAPEFRKIVEKTDTYSISPVFGGGTAQAEFEVLCGVPALHALSNVEFNVFTGTKTYCMPSILGDAGYETMASNGHKPKFFNAIPGYKGTGFANIFFPRENAPDRKTYLSTGDVEKEWYMFDGRLFEQNLSYIKDFIHKNPDKPLFNYVMSVYGHLPHYIDESVRPMFIKVLGQKDDVVERVVNQHYYRTEAIGRYVHELLKIDPHSMIILVSDHLPPLSAGPETYKKLKYMRNIDDSEHYNRIVIIENSKTMQYETIHHYDVPKLIANYLTDGAYCHTHQCSFTKTGLATSAPAHDSQEDYMTIMAHATM